jgi:hypothetical protein
LEGGEKGLERVTGLEGSRVGGGVRVRVRVRAGSSLDFCSMLWFDTKTSSGVGDDIIIPFISRFGVAAALL